MELERYEIETGGMKATVSIDKEERKPNQYKLVISQASPATAALLNSIRNELITRVKVTASEILDPKVVESLKGRFRKEAEELIKSKLPNITEKTLSFLTGSLLHEMLGFGKMEFLLNDPQLEEVIINSATEPIRVYHKKYGWLLTDVVVDSESKIQNFSSMIARRVGRQVSTLNPLLDAHLVSGDRANAVLYPISNKGHTITIRKFARDPWTITDFIKSKTCSPEIFSMLWLAIQYEMNVLISGGTGSGKTSFLNVCLPFMPPNQRILTIEDTRELQLPKNLYWCPLSTRQPNPEGKGEVTMLDLLINVLRMRPDRIILGEIRRKRDAEVLFEAMHTGHSVYATLHADSVTETVQRLTNPPIEVPPNMVSAVNLNIVMFRERRRGIRRVFQVGEFITSDDGEKTKITGNVLYRWKPSNDTITQHNRSMRLFEDLSRHTGLSQNEINKDLEEKQKILMYMVKNNIRSLEEVGKIMSLYYLDKNFVIKTVNKNAKPDVLLKG